MTLQEFLNKHKGQFMDYDGYYGPQCVDLINYFVRDVVGRTPRMDFLGAAEVMERPNTLIDCARHNYLGGGAHPQPGDIIVYKKSRENENHGHIGVVTEANAGSFFIFEQNPTAARIRQNIGYGGVLGWVKTSELIGRARQEQEAQNIKNQQEAMQIKQLQNELGQVVSGATNAIQKLGKDYPKTYPAGKVARLQGLIDTRNFEIAIRESVDMLIQEDLNAAKQKIELQEKEIAKLQTVALEKENLKLEYEKRLAEQRAEMEAKTKIVPVAPIPKYSATARGFWDTLRNLTNLTSAYLLGFGGFELFVDFAGRGDFSKESLSKFLIGFATALLAFIQSKQMQNRKDEEKKQLINQTETINNK